MAPQEIALGKQLSSAEATSASSASKRSRNSSIVAHAFCFASTGQKEGGSQGASSVWQEACFGHSRAQAG